jgi:hypothetical protein
MHSMICVAVLGIHHASRALVLTRFRGITCEQQLSWGDWFAFSMIVQEECVDPDLFGVTHPECRL